MDLKLLIKERRNSLGLSQQELADKINVSKSLISRYESGEIYNMGIDKVRALAAALELDPMIFLNESFVTEDTTVYQKSSNTLSTIAAHLDGEELTEEEMDQLNDYIDYLVSKRRKA